ncbi:S1 family peptidase [Actinophytocola sp. NPDC049390]|uniref:S1 family peptidase n=1 Tax=Actinophytocola sp. NPDC049390 TaxID=3363894 RepID=UPI00379BE650
MRRIFRARLRAGVLLALGLVLAAAATPAAADSVSSPTTSVSRTEQATWDLISGQLIYSGSTRCTLGFNARNGTSRFVVTAGHCTSFAGSWSGVGGYIGPSAGSSFPGNDFGLIQVASAAALSTPLVDRYSSGVDVTITGVATPPVGSSVCYSSPMTGWRCGSVTAINQTVCYPQGCVTGLIRTSMCPGPGSSGAPVVTNPGSGTTVRAVGLVAGASGNCTSGGTTWVQPIAEPLAAYGLTLVTG